MKENRSKIHVGAIIAAVMMAAVLLTSAFPAMAEGVSQENVAIEVQNKRPLAYTEGGVANTSVSVDGAEEDICTAVRIPR